MDKSDWLKPQICSVTAVEAAKLMSGCLGKMVALQTACGEQGVKGHQKSAALFLAQHGPKPSTKKEADRKLGLGWQCFPVLVLLGLRKRAKMKIRMRTGRGEG